ncbi:uncharacterized protein LOC134701267 [Mytilus trossulus]|uniref:uncharacterized protein LOC134701267 n=1 Tax=Mytilus trossulus TaxID=6551 RepID=UPI0030079198
MATSKNALFCDFCHNKQLNKSAQEYCPQCEEALCGECRDNHKISKLSKSHQTISIDRYNKLPSFIKNISHICEEHDCFLEVYCKSHDSLCCKRCLISGHKKCKETIFIEDFLVPSSKHQSAAFDNIEKVLKNLESNISSAIKDRNRNLTDLRGQKQVIAEQIKEKRQEINNCLNNLEVAIIEKLSATEKEYCQKIEEVIEKLNERKMKVDEIKKDVESMKIFASDLLIFMGTKTFEENVLTNELNLQGLYDNGSFENLKIVCILNEKLNRIIREIKTFGDIYVNKCEKNASFSWKGDKSAQILKSMAGDNSIVYINVKLVHKIGISGHNISGCAISEAGDMLFQKLQQNTLLRFAPNGEFHSHSNIKGAGFQSGYDLAVVNSNTIAVSSGAYPPHKIYLIDINSAETRRLFNLDDYCYGLSYHNRSFMCSTDGKGIIVFDMSQQDLNHVQTKVNTPINGNHTYVASNKNGIFHSNCHDHSVICYDYSGQVKWKYSDSLLRKPYGITLDSNSNIYVAGSDSNNIVVISPDGKHAKELVGASDGILNPRAIFFHKTKHLLLVANYNQGAFVYDVI